MLTRHSITLTLGRFFGFVALLAAVSASSHAQVLAHSGDVGFNAGLNNAGSVSNCTLSGLGYSFGGSGGYNVSQNISVLGEYQYIPQGSCGGTSVNTQFYGGLMRASFGSGKVAPYILVGGGGVREAGSGSDLNVTFSGGYIAFGGGASIFLGKNWGIRPEVRYNYGFLSGDGVTAVGGLDYQATGGVFFQFGGEGKSAKHAVASAKRY